MLFRPLFAVLIFAMTALGMPAKRDAATIQGDLKKMNVQCLSLDKAIIAFPGSGGTLSQAWAIHTGAVALEGSTTNATLDVKDSGPFTETQWNAIIQYTKGTFTPNVLKSLDDISAKSEGLTYVHANGIASDDLQNLQVAANAFWNAMIANAPAGQQGDAKGMLDEINTALESAINAVKS
ncbi:hydrophobic surface binding protein A-domain-containing protein [Chiua virens]|nr:hydrophobic surface binding protein A-domain-containing protein [Chiua virens]